MGIQERLLRGVVEEEGREVGFGLLEATDVLLKARIQGLGIYGLEIMVRQAFRCPFVVVGTVVLAIRSWVMQSLAMPSSEKLLPPLQERQERQQQAQHLYFPYSSS